jgi:uncharacterized protein (TIGR00255 family)
LIAWRKLRRAWPSCVPRSSSVTRSVWRSGWKQRWARISTAKELEEVAVIVERSDIAEELARMTTHIDHFRELLKAGGEMGKKLDFLLQEMNREANTMLSKTGSVGGKGTRITELGLAMKSEIEKAREQIQNLE